MYGDCIPVRRAKANHIQASKANYFLTDSEECILIPLLNQNIQSSLVSRQGHMQKTNQ